MDRVIGKFREHNPARSTEAIERPGSGSSVTSLFKSNRRKVLDRITRSITPKPPQSPLPDIPNSSQVNNEPDHAPKDEGPEAHRTLKRQDAFIIQDGVVYGGQRGSNSFVDLALQHARALSSVEATEKASPKRKLDGLGDSPPTKRACLSPPTPASWDHKRQTFPPRTSRIHCTRYVFIPWLRALQFRPGGVPPRPIGIHKLEEMINSNFCASTCTITCALRLAYGICDLEKVGELEYMTLKPEWRVPLPVASDELTRVDKALSDFSHPGGFPIYTDFNKNGQVKAKKPPVNHDKLSAQRRQANPTAHSADWEFRFHDFLNPFGDIPRIMQTVRLRRAQTLFQRILEHAHNPLPEEAQIQLLATVSDMAKEQDGAAEPLIDLPTPAVLDVESFEEWMEAYIPLPLSLEATIEHFYPLLNTPENQALFCRIMTERYWLVPIFAKPDECNMLVRKARIEGWREVDILSKLRQASGKFAIEHIRYHRRLDVDHKNVSKQEYLLLGRKNREWRLGECDRMLNASKSERYKTTPAVSSKLVNEITNDG